MNGANGQCGRGNCRARMKDLQALDFALVETVLYLDAYPDNRQALEYYHQLMRQREETLEAYEKTDRKSVV